MDFDWLFDNADDDHAQADDFAWIDAEPGPDGNRERDFETARQLNQPIRHERRQARNEYRAGLHREALTELVPKLPDPGTVLYIVGNGSGSETKPGWQNPHKFSFGDFLPVVVEHLGNRDCEAYVSTWTMSRPHAKTMLAMLDDGRLARLAVMTGKYFKVREAAICAELITGLTQRGQRFMAFKNHTKIIAIANPDGQTCVITASANMSAQPRAEQFTIDCDPGLYAWLVSDFFEAMLGDDANGE